MAIDKDKILDIANKFILKGQSKKAIKEYLKLVEDSPQDKRLHLKLGDLYLKNGEEQQAIQEYLKVASLYGEEDLNFRAISIYKKILSIDPKVTQALYEIAKLYAKEGLAGSAKNYYQSLLEIDPNDKEALKALQELENPQPIKVGAVSARGTASFESSAPKPPPPPPKKSLDDQSGFISPSNMDSSNLSPKPQISSEDKDAEMHYHLGIAYKEMELFDYAISEFELASSSPALKFDCYTMLGNCYMERGDYNKSIDCYKRSSEVQGLSNEKMAKLYFNLGLAYEANGMVSEAIDTFNLVLKYDRSFSEAIEKVKKLQSQTK